MLGISAGGIAEDADLDTFITSTGVTFPILRDSAETYWEYDNTGAISPYPVDIVLDADGKIVFLSRTYEPSAMRNAVENVLR